MVINGSTMEWLLHLFKLDKLPEAKEASVQKAQKHLDAEMDEYIHSLQNNPFFNKIDSNQFRLLMKHDTPLVLREESKLQQDEADIAFERRLLEIERSDYWRQFEEGHIGRQAAFTLSRSVEQALDNKPIIAPRDFLNESFKVPTPPRWLSKLPIMGEHMQEWLFTRLSLSYDIARGFVEAQEEIRKHIESLQPNKDSGVYVNTLIDANTHKVFAFIQHINKEYPQLITKLQKKSAHRLLINHKRSLTWKMEHEGVLEAAEAQHIIDNIELEMLQLRDSKNE